MSVLALATLGGATPALAHTGHEVGDYVLEIGWLHEPAFVGQPNAVQVTITDHHDSSPILDLGADDIKVVVSTAGTDSASLSFEPAFDAEEKEGSLGEYDAALVPTAPGDYTFHITGSIHGTAVDLTVASGDETFDPVVASTDLEFPAKMPSLTEVGTRLDRIDARIAALQSAAPGGSGDAALKAAQDAASAATAAAATANNAMTIGLLVGGAGLVIAVVSLFVAMRATRHGRRAG
ncbi:MAG TPA: hypothetical protein VJ850_03135 [Candidatus Limnocylindrales bacterium]|nr:hypothetical protein [Candidatus Limnocylindrales bacterium]